MAITIVYSFVLVAIILLALFLPRSIRHKIAFESIFGVPPKKASQKIVSEKIVQLQKIQKALVSYESGEVSTLTELDRYIMGFFQNELEPAKELAKRYDFQVPLVEQG